MTNEITTINVGDNVAYIPFEDDAVITKPTTGKVTEINEDGTVNLSFGTDGSVTRQFVSNDEIGSFNTWSKAALSISAETEAVTIPAAAETSNDTVVDATVAETTLADAPTAHDGEPGDIQA